MEAIPHHIGCAATDLEKIAAIYADALGLRRRTRPFNVRSQYVRVCFVELGNCFYLELIAPSSDKAKISSFLRTGFYHLCFLVDDLTSARHHMKTMGFAALPAFESEAFAGSVCQFLVSPQGHLIELAQMSTTAFGDFFRANLENEE